MGDKAYGAKTIREYITSQNASYTIPHGIQGMFPSVSSELTARSKQKNEASDYSLPRQCGAANRGRTGTVLLPRDFKSLVSANSTIAALFFVCRHDAAAPSRPSILYNNRLSISRSRLCKLPCLRCNKHNEAYLVSDSKPEQKETCSNFSLGNTRFSSSNTK